MTRATVPANGDTAPSARSPLHDVLSAHPKPLSRDTPDKSAIAIGERAFLGKLAILGSEDSFHSAVAEQLNFSLPQTPNTTETHDDVTAMWLSPNEWMLVTPPGREPDLAVSLQRALSDVHSLVVDVSDRWTVIAVTGMQAISVLGKGTSVKLEPPAFGVGRCCQTRLFSSPVIILQTDESPSFDVFVDSTLSEDLWRWLEHSANGLDVHVFAPSA